MFQEFGFHAHQTRLNGSFILSAYVGLQVSQTKNENVWNDRWYGFNEVGVAVLPLFLHPKRQQSSPSQGRDKIR